MDKNYFWHSLTIIIGVTFLSCAQAPLRLLSIYPSGGTPGSVVEVLAEVPVDTNATLAYISGEGVKATYLGALKATTLKVATKNRYLRFRVAIGGDAPPGLRALRVGTRTLLSEGLAFEIGTLPETTQARTALGSTHSTKLALPCAVNGFLTADSPRYSFVAEAGSQIVAHLEATLNFPGLPLPQVEFLDAQGVACTSVQAYTNLTSRTVVLNSATGGTYTMRVQSSKPKKGQYRPFRVKVGELPLITDIKPRQAAPGASLTVRLEGVNLPQKRLRLFTGGKDSAACWQTIIGDAMALSELSFDLENELNMPDYRVHLPTTTLNIPSGGSYLVQLQAQRFNGLQGAIQVGLNLPPLGIISEGGTIKAGENVGWMTISTEGTRYPKIPFAVDLVATTTHDEQILHRQVVALAPTAKQVQGTMSGSDNILALASSTAPAIKLNVVATRPLKISLKNGIALNLTSNNLTTPLAEHYEIFVQEPAGIQVQEFIASGSVGTGLVKLRVDAQQLQLGDQGNVLLGCAVKSKEPAKTKPIAHAQYLNFEIVP